MKNYLIIFLFLIGCSTPQIEQKQANLIELNNNQFEENVYRFSEFNIFSLKKVKNDNLLTIYIEGDGQAWLSRFKPSSDPTPVNPTAFKLALQDQSDNVIYLSRPCQYISGPACENSKIWTSLQYSEAVLGVYSRILEELSKEYQEIHLVGFSGGAAIAMFLASKDFNIRSIRTVAGNINPDEIVKLLNLSGYNKEVNFFSLEKKIKDLSQTHYYGIKDKVVPNILHLNYDKRNSINKCTKIQPVKASHQDGWIEFWKENYKLKINC